MTRSCRRIVLPCCTTPDSSAKFIHVESFDKSLLNNDYDVQNLHDRNQLSRGVNAKSVMNSRCQCH